MRIPMYVDLLNQKMAYKMNGEIYTLDYNKKFIEMMAQGNTLVTIGIWGNHIGLTSVINLYEKCTFSTMNLSVETVEQKVEIIDRLEQRYAKDEPK